MDDGKAYRDDKGFTASDYDDAAESLELEGNKPLAMDARDKADAIRDAGKQSAEDRVVRKAQSDWERSKGELEGEMPELKDPENHLTQTANQILKDYPDLLYVPEGKGLRHAVQIAQWKVASESADKSQAEVNELKEKLDKLEKITSVDGGYSSDKPSGDKGFDDLSDNEQESYLRRAAAQLDDAM